MDLKIFLVVLTLLVIIIFYIFFNITNKMYVCWCLLSILKWILAWYVCFKSYVLWWSQTAVQSNWNFGISWTFLLRSCVNRKLVDVI